MGALHRGHTTLIDRARELVGPAGSVAVSLFVNPTQFGPAEDFTRYPRPFETDRALCELHQADLLFHPQAEAIYPPGFSTYVNEEEVSRTLCGASRPGHYRGVCTVVSKLFNLLQPDFALFGLKDFQQCKVITRMVRDLNMPVQIVPVETVREPDGLALSSRNQYLSPEERSQAPLLRCALLKAAEMIRAGQTDAAWLRALLREILSGASLARIDYIEIADATTLEPLNTVGPNSVIALAVFFGKTRLIDNLLLE